MEDVFSTTAEKEVKMTKKNTKRLLGYSMTMGGTGLIAGGLPAPAKAPVQTVATTGSAFVRPMAAVTGAGIVVGQLKKLKLKKRRRALR